MQPTPRRTPQRRSQYVEIDDDSPNNTPAASSNLARFRESTDLLDYFHESPDFHTLRDAVGVTQAPITPRKDAATPANGRYIPLRAPPRTPQSPSPRRQKNRPAAQSDLNEDPEPERIQFSPQPQLASSRQMSNYQVQTGLRSIFGPTEEDPTVDGVNLDVDGRVDGFEENFSLKPHQITARRWMKSRENPRSTKKGGILADDMGLGKTVEMLVRIMDDKNSVRKDDDDAKIRATLVVAPVSVLSHWKSEAERLAPGLRIRVYYGNDRHLYEPATLNRFDLVITSYDTVRSDYAAHQSRAKDERQVPTPPSTPKKRPTKRAKGNDQSEWGSASDNDMDSDDNSHDEQVGQKRKKKALKPTGRGALFQNVFRRVVLDEASHRIKNYTSQTATACYHLKAKFRWCLSGTPLHNSVYDLHSLFVFLNIKPLNDTHWFSNHIGQPIETGYQAKQGLEKLHAVLCKVMLRRLKTQLINGLPIVELPEKKFDLVSLEMQGDERSFYCILEHRLRSKVIELAAQAEKSSLDAAGRARAAWALRASVYVMLMRLRQACDHPSLILKENLDEKEAILIPEGESQELQPREVKTIIKALQTCRMCCKTLSTKTEKFCQECGNTLAAQHFHFKNKPSTKLTAILDLLRDIRTKSGKMDKTVIYSQFTTMLDLIGSFLSGKGYRSVRYDGRMTLKQRDESLNSIRTEPETTIMLVSLMAGGAGLNLTCCNHLILVDPWWNPAIEEQAFERLHRIGQTKPVQIHKLVIKNTVEDRILSLQDRKRRLADAALSKEGIDLVKQMTTEELVKLFGTDDPNTNA